MATNVFNWEKKHTSTSGAINAATGAMAIGSVASLYHVGGSYTLMGAAVGALGSMIGGLAREEEEKLSKGALCYRAACWLGAGGWMSYAISQPGGPMHVATVGTLGVGAAVMGSMGAVLANKRRKRLEAREAAISLKFRNDKAEEWSDRFDRVCGVKGCRVLNVEEWKDEQGNKLGSGYTLEVELPPGGKTWRDIQSHQDGLASDARLPEGCGVEVTHGVSRGVFLAKVSTLNALAEVQNLPNDYSPLNYNEDFDIGVKRDGSRVMVNMRENSGIMAGQKRTGKTNQLQVFISRYVRMTNLLVWIIDFNGGNLALSWLAAWEELGCPGRPPIDWVASDDEEALMMAKAAARIAKHRKVAYNRLKRAKNTDLLPLSEEIPGIMIVTDEGIEIYGQQNLTGAANKIKRETAESMVETLRIAGESGVNELNCFLRATADATGDPMVKKMSNLRVGMKMQDADELAYLFGWKSKVAPEDMPEQGFGAYAQGEMPAETFRGYRVLHSHINDIVKAVCNTRPMMDAISVGAAGQDYLTRWDRAGYLFEKGEVPVRVKDREPEEVYVETEETSNAGTPLEAFDAPSASKSSDQAWKNLRKAIAENEMNNRGDMTPEEEKAAWEEIIKNLDDIPDWSDPNKWPTRLPVENTNDAGEASDETNGADEVGGDVATLKMVVFGIVKASGPDGIKPSDVLKALERAYPGRELPVLKTITRWLQADDRIWQPTGYGKYAVKPKKGEGK